MWVLNIVLIVTQGENCFVYLVGLMSPGIWHIHNIPICAEMYRKFEYECLDNIKKISLRDRWYASATKPLLHFILLFILTNKYEKKISHEYCKLILLLIFEIHLIGIYR